MKSVFLYNKMLLNSNSHVLMMTLLSHTLKSVQIMPSPPSETTASQLNTSNPEVVGPLRLQFSHAHSLPFCNWMRTSHQPVC